MKFTWILCAAYLIIGRFAPSLQAADRRPEYANDLGPSAIDVSHYPPEMQEGYKRFQAKCAACHSAARAVNSEFTTPKEWTHYVTRMYMRPPCCNRCPTISREEAKRIYKFLVYDSQIRKTGPQAQAWALQRAELLNRFKTEYPQKYAQRYAGSNIQKKELQ